MKEWDGNNRRNFVRMKYPCLLVINKNTADRVAILTHTDNLSIGGVYTMVKDELQLNAQVSLEIDLMDMSEHICCGGEIVWVKMRQADSPFKPSFYDVGIRFVDIALEDTQRLEKLIDYLHKRQDEVPYN